VETNRLAHGRAHAPVRRAYAGGVFGPPTDSSGWGTGNEDILDLDRAGTDVQFGGRRRHSRASQVPRRWPTKWWPVAAIVVAALTTSLVVHHQAGLHSAPTTTVAQPTVSPTTVLRPVRSTESAPSTQAQTGRLLANDLEWGLFFQLQSSSGLASTKRIDLDTGVITDGDPPSVSGDFGYSAFGVTGSGSNAYVVSTADLGGATSAAPGPNGTTWAIGQDLNNSTYRLNLLQTRRGSQPAVLDTFDLAGLDVQPQYLVGSTANGEPLFFGTDRSVFALRPQTRTLSRFAPAGLVTIVDHGRYAIVRCDTTATCVLELHGGATTASVDFGAYMTASISPDGMHALILGSVHQPDFVHLIDLRTGVDTVTVEPFNIDDQQGRGAAWTPDSSTVFVVSARRQIVGISADGRSSSHSALPDGFNTDDFLVGIA
jgi:hypothetical protein